MSANESTGVTDRKTVLVVDDDPAMRKFMVKALLTGPYRVMAVDNGADAEDWILNRSPDLVIMDIMLPYKSGADICIEMKSDARKRHVPILLITSLADDTRLSGDQWRDLTRADAFLPKPFAISDLMSRVEALLAKREPALA